jgi:hypothetical protein
VAGVLGDARSELNSVDELWSVVARVPERQAVELLARCASRDERVRVAGDLFDGFDAVFAAVCADETVVESCRRSLQDVLLSVLPLPVLCRMLSLGWSVRSAVSTELMRFSAQIREGAVLEGARSAEELLRMLSQLQLPLSAEVAGVWCSFAVAELDAAAPADRVRMTADLRSAVSHALSARAPVSADAVWDVLLEMFPAVQSLMDKHMYRPSVECVRRWVHVLDAATFLTWFGEETDVVFVEEQVRRFCQLGRAEANVPRWSQLGVLLKVSPEVVDRFVLDVVPDTELVAMVLAGVPLPSGAASHGRRLLERAARDGILQQLVCGRSGSLAFPAVPVVAELLPLCPQPAAGLQAGPLAGAVTEYLVQHRLSVAEIARFDEAVSEGASFAAAVAAARPG